MESKFIGRYTDDYEVLEGDSHSWLDKYTTAIFSEEKIWNRLVLQPVPDYIRFYTSKCEMHYLPFEEHIRLPDGPWNSEPEMFFPSRILDMAFLVIQDFSSVTVKHLSLLAWCPKTEVEMYLEHKAKQMEEDYNTTLERDCWTTHPLHKERRSMLEEKCSKEGLDTRGGKHCLVRWIVK